MLTKQSTHACGPCAPLACDPLLITGVIGVLPG